jgi:bacterioferritin-associated ferredoxin
MRIPCAKCGHVHDSTVTPFLHDILNNPKNVSKYIGIRTKCYESYFKCGKCGNTNSVMLKWSVVEEADDVSDNTNN